MSEAHKKAIYGREIIHHAYSFVKSFCRDFLKIFSPHRAHNPETRRTFVFYRVRQKQGDFKLPLFAFSLKIIFNLILKLNLKTVSNSKTVLNLILNLKMFHAMFHVKHKINHKKPIYGQKIVLPRLSFVKNFFQKIFWCIAARVPKRKGSPRGA